MSGRKCGDHRCSHESTITRDIGDVIQWIMIPGHVSGTLTSQIVTSERAPRKRLELAVTLAAQGEEYSGCCMNVSTSGMLIRVHHELPVYLVWSLGYLTGEIQGISFRLRIRIARTDEDRVGVAFQISHANDRDLIRLLMEASA